LRPRQQKTPTRQRRERRPRGLDPRLGSGRKPDIGENAAGFEHACLRDRRLEAGLPVERTPDVRDDEPPGIERRHGRLRNIQACRLLAAHRSIRVENLEVNEKGAGQARTPPDHDISVDQAGHHGDAVQPRDGIGAKLGAVFRSLESNRCARIRSSCRLSTQTMMKPPSGRRAMAGRTSGSTAAVLTWLSGPDNVSWSKVRSFSYG
jgi:hypothetical protein